MNSFVRSKKMFTTLRVAFLGLEMTTISYIEKIRLLLLQNRYLSFRMIADEVNMSKDTVKKIIIEDLKKRRICSHNATIVKDFLTKKRVTVLDYLICRIWHLQLFFISQLLLEGAPFWLNCRHPVMRELNGVLAAEFYTDIQKFYDRADLSV